jgi:hypothetical protein
MVLRKIFTGLIILVGFHYAQAQTVEMGKVRLTFSLDHAGRPLYAVDYDNHPVILPSSTGFALADDPAFYKDFKLLSTTTNSVDENWQPVWGEVKNIRNHYRELTVHLQQQQAPFRLLDLVFRVFNEGIGFRYTFPKQGQLKYFVITDELTQFHLAGDHKTFWIPGDYDTNEYPYTTSKLSEIDNKHLVDSSFAIAVRVAPDRYAVQTPLMMKSNDGLYINIHEAALVGYPAMQLHTDASTYTLTSQLVPDAMGNKAYLHAPFSTPWRTIIVSDQATDLLASKMILNLNEPSVIKNTSWIHPMKFVGVWWEMQSGKSSWNYSDFADSTNIKGQPLPNGRHGANTAHVKRHIDFAARHGIQGVLVEGWNTGWEDWFGNWKENVFDFVTPYPDFDIKAVTAYAKSKGVKMIMHNETSGAVTSYERQMDTAFRFMKQWGYPAVKTGYVGKIIPRGEHHDGQWMIQHYQRVLDKAAQYEVMVDAHEPARPTGLQRTYPHFLASEAGRGNEYNAFSSGNAPEHETILPFTRLMGGPMDYTPGIFKLKYFSYDSTRQVHTTLAKQLALYVTLYSPLQMVADLPENYEAHPDAFQFIKDVPVNWDDTKILEAEPGAYVTIAREEKGNWFIGAITNEQARITDIPLSFLAPGKQYKAIIYRDGDDADWEHHPESYKIEQQNVTNQSILHLKLAPGGGTAVSIKGIVNGH